MTAVKLPALGSKLTDREIQVLVGMALGKSNAQIGRDMFLSEDTIKTYARRLFRRLGARDRANAVWLGVLAGVLAAPSGSRIDVTAVAW